MENNNEFNNLDKDFEKLVKDDKLNISTIEGLMLDNIENYKTRLKTHVEELLVNEVDEKELTTKKTRMGRKRI